MLCNYIQHKNTSCIVWNFPTSFFKKIGTLNLGPLCKSLDTPVNIYLEIYFINQDLIDKNFFFRSSNQHWSKVRDPQFLIQDHWHFIYLSFTITLLRTFHFLHWDLSLWMKTVRELSLLKIKLNRWLYIIINHKSNASQNHFLRQDFKPDES